mmetsp:Transcript_2141/g.8356  ORF Transcript_2141/g.8356 Transcript_2141/m.8356 type:complete len:686 (+) Transcript_2141:92-2149(+)
MAQVPPLSAGSDNGRSASKMSEELRTQLKLGPGRQNGHHRATIAACRSTPSFEGGGDDENEDFFGAFVELHGLDTAEQRRKKKKMQMMSELFSKQDAAAQQECTKCEDLQKKHAENKRLAIMETEHLRRGLEKVMEQCAVYMSGPKVQEMVDNLQLDVRYMTKEPELPEGTKIKEGRLAQKGNFSSAGDGGLVEKLKKQIAMLEDDVSALKTKIGQGGDDGPSAPLAGGGGKRGLTVAVAVKTFETAITQTNPVKFDSGGAAPARDESSPGKEGKEKTGASRNELANKKVAKKRPQDDSSSSDDDSPSRGPGQRDEGGEVSAKKARKPRGPKEALGSAVDDGEAEELREKLAALQRDFNKAQSEKGLLEMKLKSAERATAKAESRTKEVEAESASKDVEIESLKRKLADAQKLTDALENKVRDLSGAANPQEEIGKASGRGGNSSPQDTSSPKKKKNKGPDVPVKEKKGIVKRQLMTDAPEDGSGGGAEVGSAGEGKEGAATAGGEEADEVASEDEDCGPKMVDQCIGPGPGPGLGDDPVRCVGHRAPGLPRALNPSTKCYMREVRSVPFLVATASAASPSSPSSPPTTDAGVGATPMARSAAALSASTPSPVARCLDFGATREPGLARSPAAKTLMSHTGRPGDPEPYLLQLWSQRPKGGVRLPSGNEPMSVCASTSMGSPGRV